MFTPAVPSVHVDFATRAKARSIAFIPSIIRLR
jgi:hypothetical protein